MSFQLSRRNFVAGLGSVAAALVVPDGFGASLTLAPQRIRFGYAAITWGGKDLQAIKEVGEVGFRGIQLRSPILKDFGDKPKELKNLLAQNKLTFVALSGGGPKNDEYVSADEIATQVKHANFLRDAGGLYLQMTDSARPKDRKPGSDDFKRLGRLLSDIGKRTADLGIPMAYHNHMRSLGEAPDEVDALMDAADPRYVKLLLDVAHYAQGGGNPIKAIEKHHERILFLHIKDVESVTPTAESSSNYRFVELGRGRVDLPGVFAALEKVKFQGWAIVELDSVPDKSRTPRESAMISKTYLESKLGMKI
ncbi:MAG TPA: sugar phosphate isomerase/epimerase [Blastocatellia bacterium]|nr:sugar phosphate isomerase/epimerase [Blastocatellia bacterium]